jgi:hypothetical protein
VPVWKDETFYSKILATQLDCTRREHPRKRWKMHNWQRFTFFGKRRGGVIYLTFLTSNPFNDAFTTELFIRLGIRRNYEHNLQNTLVCLSLVSANQVWGVGNLSDKLATQYYDNLHSDHTVWGHFVWQVSLFTLQSFSNMRVDGAKWVVFCMIKKVRRKLTQNIGQTK